MNVRRWAVLASVLALAGAFCALPARDVAGPRTSARVDGGPRNWTNHKGGPGRVMTWTDPKVKPPFRLKWVFWGEDSGTKVGLLAVDGVILFPNIGRFGGGCIFGVNAQTGKEIWRYRVGGPYVATMDATDGVAFFPEKSKGLLALDVKTGHRRWQRADLGGGVNPLAVDGRVYVSGTREGGTLYAAEAATGKTIWSKDLGIGKLGAPCYSGGTVVVNGARGTVAVNAADGAEKWRVESTGSLGGLYPTLIDDGRVYLCANRETTALRLADGEQLWKERLRVRCAGDGKVYGNTFAADGKTGKLIWSVARKSIEAEGDICCAPVYHDGVIYFGTGFGSSSRYVESLMALDAASGKVLWRYKTGSVVCASPIIYDGKLYFGSADRGLYCFQHDAGKEGKS